MLGLDAHLWALARDAARSRDRYRCQAVEKYGTFEIACGEPATHVHHIDPAGAKYDLGNLLTLCSTHHARLHHRNPALRDRRKKRARANAAAYQPFGG